jgi:hypothetical protein
MADTPTPRSYQQILGDSIDVLLSKAGLKGIKVGGPIAEILETQATSAMRTSQDIFQMLASRDVDNADGEALARAGRDEGLEQEGATFATTLVTVGDSNFIKKSTRIYQAKAAPAAGTSVVYVIDASSFPASGSIYLGRGTANAEGPLAYSSRALDGSGNFWAITLAGNTTKFHNVGDSVIVAQGGDRVVGVGTICTTLARNDGTSLKFETTNRVVLQDGEDLISGVRVRCLTAGIEGNVPAGAIQDFDSAPFVGATVTNLSKVTNALAAESKEEFRERIKAARRSKTKGTGLAITSAVFRASASDEDATVTSSNLVVQDDTYTLYIDDGSGYEPKSSGIAIETLIESAAGGEQDFQILGGVPLVKAFSKARDVAPYNLTDGSVLSVKIGGETSSVSFLAEDFLDITNATAYEVVSAINADPNSTFAARTVDSGQSFVVFAKADANEDVQVIAAASGLTDANEIFAFPAARYDTLRLYLNDVLLYKDGIDAAIDSTPQSQWNSTNFATGIKMTVAVDGTVGVQYTFTDADFVNARTGYTALAAGNSLAAWAAVINAKIPGLTATAQSNTLRIKSNLGASSRASVVLSAMDAGFQSMFSTTSATGRDADYSLNRNTGEIHLTDALQPGDRLSAGTPYTRAYIESGDFSALTVGGSGANLWWVVDGAAQVISTGTTVGTIYTVSISGGWFITLTGAAGSFSNVQSGDWLILWDSSFGSKLQGTWRVSAATSTTVTFEIGTSLPSTGALPALTAAGLAVVRSDAVVQKLVVPAGSVSPASIAGMVAVQMFGVSATTPRSTRLRLTTDTFGGSGDISLVAADTEGAKLPFTIKNVVSNTPHLGSSESGNTDHGTPNFYWGTITGTGNNGHLADSNCVALWRMDEAAGSTAADATGNGYTLTSGAQVPAVIAGVIGNGRSFVANVGTPLNSNYFATADMGTTNAALIHTGPYTVEGWFARTGPKAGARSYGVYFGFGGALNTLLRAYYDPSTGNIGLGWYNGFDFFYDTGVSTALNTWFHMAVRMTSLGGVNRQLELFVNGVKVYTTPSTPQPLASTDLTFSVGTTDANFGTIWADDIRFSKVARTDQEILDSYNRALSLRSGIIVVDDTQIAVGQGLVWKNPLSTDGKRVATNWGDQTIVTSLTAGPTLTYERTTNKPVVNDRIHGCHLFAIGAEDVLNVVLDNDSSTKSFSTALYYKVAPTSAAVGYYGATLTIAQGDGSGTSLSSVFPATFDFSDFKLRTQARAISTPPADADSTVNALLWRFKRFGPDGAKARLSYTNPTAPSQDFAVSTSEGDLLDLFVQLPSGAARAPTLGQRYAVESSTYGPSLRKICYYAGVRVSVSSDGAGHGTATLTTGGGAPNPYITNHRFVAGDLVYLYGGSAFAAGFVTVSGTGLTTTSFQFDYVVGGLAPLSAGPETVNMLSSTGTVPTLPLALTGVVVGDLLTVSGNTRLDSTAQGTFRVADRDATNGLWVMVHADAGTALALAYKEILDPSYFQFFPLDTSKTNTAGTPNLATRVNALASNLWVQGAVPVWTKTGVGVVAGSAVTISTLDAYLEDQTKPKQGFTFSGGSFYIPSSSFNGTHYVITINGTAPAASLWSSNEDWTNERAYLVPSTAPTLARFLNLAGITGLASNGELKASSRQGRLQIATDLSGSDGSVQVTGGSANGVVASIFDAAVPTSGSYCISKLRASDAVGLYAGQWVALQGLNKVPKTLNWTATSTLAVDGPTSKFTIAVAGTVAKYAGSMTASINSKIWQIEKHGRFAAYVYADTGSPTNFSNVQEGDWVQITSATGSSINKGYFRVIRVLYSGTKYTFWVENPNMVSESVVLDTIAFWTADSILPGDTFLLNTTTFGNQGSWTVASIGAADGSGNVSFFTVNGTLTTQTATVFGTDLRNASVLPASQSRLIKRIGWVAPNGSNSAYMTVAFDTLARASEISASAGTVLTALDKLGFDTGVAVGLDGYQKNTGLVAECNKILYGDLSDTATYPGVISKGANINIDGPLVHRVQVSLSIRVRQGTQSDVIARVQSAVAQVINSAGVGEAISFADIIAAAKKVRGVSAVTVLSPTFDASNDMISVQSFEKPMVLNLDSDVLVSITGA